MATERENFNICLRQNNEPEQSEDQFIIFHEFVMSEANIQTPVRRSRTANK